MIVIDGVRISKFDIRTLKVGKNVPFELKEELKKFNSGFLGEESVFPTKNGAPRILTQYKDDPYTLELLDQYTTTMPGRKPKPLPTIKANHHHGKPARQAKSWNISCAPRQSWKDATIQDASRVWS